MCVCYPEKKACLYVLILLAQAVPKPMGVQGDIVKLLCVSLQGAERISSEAQTVSVEKENVRPIYRAQGKKKKRFPRQRNIQEFHSRRTLLEP